MKRKGMLRIVIGTALVAVMVASAISAQDKYSLRVPLPFADIRGYESWEVIAISTVSTPEGKLKAIVGNPTMIQAFKAGIPGSGKPFPDGSKVVKIVWNTKKNSEAPFDVTVPGVLDKVEFMEKDAKRFQGSGGWGYAPFKYDATSDTLAPIANDAECGAACHTIVTKKDFVFTMYARR